MGSSYALEYHKYDDGIQTLMASMWECQVAKLYVDTVGKGKVGDSKPLRAFTNSFCLGLVPLSGLKCQAKPY